jgi:hypothetical protein
MNSMLLRKEDRRHVVVEGRQPRITEGWGAGLPLAPKTNGAGVAIVASMSFASWIST